MKASKQPNVEKRGTPSKRCDGSTFFCKMHFNQKSGKILTYTAIQNSWFLNGLLEFYLKMQVQNIPLWGKGRGWVEGIDYLKKKLIDLQIFLANLKICISIKQRKQRHKHFVKLKDNFIGWPEDPKFSTNPPSHPSLFLVEKDKAAMPSCV